MGGALTRMLGRAVAGSVAGKRVYLKSASAEAFSSGVPTPALPSGWVENDIFILEVMSANQTVATPSGWTAFASNPQGTGTAGAAGSTALNLFWKRATSSESAPTIADSGAVTYTTILCYSGAITTGSPIEAESGTVASVTSTSVTWPAITTLTDGSMVCDVLSQGVSNNGGRQSTFANSDLIHKQVAFNDGAALTPGGGLSSNNGLKLTAGAVTASTGTLLTTSVQGLISFAIKPEPRAVPYLVALSSQVSSIGATTLTIPTVYAANDIFLLFIETANQPHSAPSGFTEVTNSPQGVGTAGATGATSLNVFWKRVSASESDISIADTGDHQLATLIVIRGCRTTGDPYEASAGDTQGSSTTAVSIPGVTTLGADRLIVVATTTDLDSLNEPMAGGGIYTNANLRFAVGATSAATSGGNGGGIGVGVGEMAAAGSTGATTTTLVSAGVQARISLALVPG